MNFTNQSERTTHYSSQVTFIMTGKGVNTPQSSLNLIANH